MNQNSIHSMYYYEEEQLQQPPWWWWIKSAGGPGSGKGTQCDKLVKDFGLQHLSLGDLLRDEVKQGSKIGRESSKLMAEGKLVPTSVSLELLKKAMCTSSSRDCQGYLIDGFPRAVDQATAFHKEVGFPLLNPTT